MVPSASLVTRFAARWSADELADHRYAAEVLADVAPEPNWPGRSGRAGTGLTETALQARVVAGMEARGLKLTTRPIVGFGANAANPHYEPEAGKDATLAKDQVILLDLWGGRGSTTTVFADQTWMGFSGRPGCRTRSRGCGARSGTPGTRRSPPCSRGPGRGGRWRGSRATGRRGGSSSRRGTGKYFVHRTGHSIDRDLHGSGPHLDDYETHDDRELLPGVGFSVEPGIYISGQFGVRSEINMYWGPEGPEVTPAKPQRQLVKIGG